MSEEKKQRFHVVLELLAAAITRTPGVVPCELKYVDVPELSDGKPSEHFKIYRVYDRQGQNPESPEHGKIMASLVDPVEANRLVYALKSTAPTPIVDFETANNALFLQTLLMAANIYGWSGDLIEVHKFVEWCFTQADCPDEPKIDY